MSDIFNDTRSRPSAMRTMVYNQNTVKTNIGSDETAEEVVRRQYPEMVDEFEKIQAEMFQTFCKKQRNYGPGNISVGTALETQSDVKLSLTGLWFRMNDKIQRIKQLVVLGEPDEVGESIGDTYQDLSVYGIIAQIVQRGKWAK